MKCPSCGYVSFSDSEKCKKCGKLLPRETAAPKKPASVESVDLKRESPPSVVHTDLPLNSTRPAEPASAAEVPISAAAAQPAAHATLVAPSIAEVAAPTPVSQPAPAPASDQSGSAAEWRDAVRKRVQERRERVPPPPARVITPQQAASKAEVQPPSLPPADQAQAGAPPQRTVQPPSIDAEPSRSAQTAGPYDTTIEMAPAVRHERSDHHASASAAQIPLFPEQVTTAPPEAATSPSRRRPSHRQRSERDLSADLDDTFGEPPAGRKAAACIVDALLVAIPWGIALFSADNILNQGMLTIITVSWLPMLILFFVIHTLYDVFFLPTLSETPGQALFGLRLSVEGRVNGFKAVLFSLGSFFSLIVIGAGFVWALMDPDRRCWPELAAGGRLIQK